MGWTALRSPDGLDCVGFYAFWALCRARDLMASRRICVHSNAGSRRNLSSAPPTHCVRGLLRGRTFPAQCPQDLAGASGALGKSSGRHAFYVCGSCGGVFNRWRWSVGRPLGAHGIYFAVALCRASWTVAHRGRAAHALGQGLNAKSHPVGGGSVHKIQVKLSPSGLKRK